MGRKCYGRIYVFGPPESVDRVEELAHELEPDERSYYKPGIITQWQGKVELVYTHKWEPCRDRLTLACAIEGIPIWCISQRDERFHGGPYASRDSLGVSVGAK